MSGKNDNDQIKSDETTSSTGSVESVASVDSSTSGNSGSDQGSSETTTTTTTTNTTYVPMPENGLPALSQMTGLSVDELYEMNKDLLQNKLSFTVGQMVRIPG